MAQTSFQLYSDKWAVGQIADNSLNQIDSFISSTIIPFGGVVTRTVTNNVVSQNKVSWVPTTLPTAGSVIGIAIRREMEVTGQYEIGHQVDVLRFGRIIVIVPEDSNVKVNDLAYTYSDGAINNNANNGRLIGRFLSDAKVETMFIAGELKSVKLAELQVDLLENK